MTQPERAKQLQMYAEDLMLVMNASKIKKDAPVFGGYPIPLRAFDKAQPTGLEEVVHADNPEPYVLGGVAPGDLIGGQVNFAAVASGGIHSASAFGEDVAVRHYQTVRRPLLPVTMLTRHIVASRRLFLNRRTGVGLTSVVYYGTNGGPAATWIDLPKGRPLVETNPAELLALRAAMGFQFGSDYLWHAHLKLPGAEAGLMIPTTPEGARALFRLRDYEAGASRRKALIHWVSEHSRRIRKDTIEETRTWVREHTRGATKFKWQDMDGAIYPAAYDLRRLKEASQ